MEKEKNEGIQAASFSDCTGLIPTLPQNKAELESYEELYPFLPPEESIKSALDKKEIRQE